MGHIPVRPTLIEDISDLIGEEAMRAVWKAVGGTRAYIPARVRPTHWLVQLIGLEAAGKLCRHYAYHTHRKVTGKHDHHGKMGMSGVVLEFPVFPRDNDKTITEMSSRKAALKLGISQRTVHRRRTKLREERA